MEITLTELEDAINYWRQLRPSQGEESALSSEVNALATDYALMIFNAQKSAEIAAFSPRVRELLEGWRRHVESGF